MFKKAILAAAITSIVTPAISATWLTNEATKPTHSLEGMAKLAATAGGAVVSGEGILILGTEYAQNDLITFTSSVAKATNVAWPTSVASTQNTAAHTAIINLAAGYAKGTTGAMIVDNVTGTSTAGDYVTIAGKGPYRISARAATTMTIAGGTGEAIADNAVVAAITKKKVTLTLTSSDATSATYRVSAVEAKFAGGGANAATTTVGTVIRFDTPDLDAAALTAAGSATLSSSATTGAGTAMDSNATALSIAATNSAYAFTVGTKFDGKVSVDLNRKSFEGPAQADTFVYTLSETAGIDGVDGAGVAITAIDPAIQTSSLAITASGDGWGFLDTTAAAGILLSAANSVGIPNVGGTNPAALTFDATGKIMTLTDTAVRAGEIMTVTKAAGATSNNLPVQDYSATMTITHRPSGGAAADDLSPTITAAAGAWTLNAASITAYGVPFGEKVSRMLWVNNSGTTLGDISATFTQDGVTTDLGVLGTAAVKASTAISGLLDAGLVTAGVTPAADSRANIAVTVTSPANDITMSAAYRVIADGDRLTIETSDTTDGTGK
jgi:hypothetical protein